jgi:lipopolysaccharide transport system permease protein
MEALTREQAASTGAAHVGAATRKAATVVDVPMRILASLRETWAERSLIAPLGARFLAKRIQNTKLGRLWLLIRPLMDSLGKTLLFGGVLNISTGSRVPYFLFLFAGLLGWRLFERGLLYASRSFSVYRKLMTSFDFPLLTVPIAGLAYPAVELAVYWLVFLGGVGVFWITDGTLYLQTNAQLLLVIPGLALMTAITIGAVLWASVLNAKARDTRLALRYFLPGWLYLTPVVYPASKLAENGLGFLVVVNPMAAPVELIKAGLIGGVELDPVGLAGSIAAGVVLVVGGLWYFCREAAKSVEIASQFDDDDDDEDDEDPVR